jgi:hypothetical protein
VLRARCAHAQFSADPERLVLAQRGVAAVAHVPVVRA